MLSEKQRSSVIIIPSLDPGEELIGYCEELISEGFEKIILVDDGSDAEHRKIFDKLKENKECTVLRHAINLGKGRGLKNALNYFLTLDDLSDYYGAITVDSDGQHTVPDVIRLSDRLKEDAIAGKETLLLGSRDFDLSHVPFKSRWGNRITRGAFHLLHGVKLKDTQTGLRAIPTAMAPKFVDIFGERFEYEMNMLIVAAHTDMGVEEIPIETVYLNENAGTHFNPVADSYKIYKLLFGTFFKYIMSSLTSFLIDIAIFQFALMLVKQGQVKESVSIVIATIVARIISSIYNYLVNRNVVFGSKSNGWVSLVKYYVLAAIQCAASAALVAFFFKLIGIPETLVKIVVDFVLFMISFQIQKRLIFKE